MEKGVPAVGDGQLWDLTLAQFREATAGLAMPGCGAVSAVVADFGLALVVKALQVSEKRERREQRQGLLQSAQALLGRPGAFADDDVAAFHEFLQARRHDPQAQQAASRQACAVPLATARACLEALDLAEAAWPEVVESVRCDVHAGALLIATAIDAVLLNVDADLDGLSDSTTVEEVRLLRRKPQDQADEHRERFAERI